MEQYRPLEGVKVVELSLMVASASCGRMMADWGADVIKVENTKGGDNFRKWPLGIGAPAEDDFDPIFDNLNANKRAISLDIRKRRRVSDQSAHQRPEKIWSGLRFPEKAISKTCYDPVRRIRGKRGRGIPPRL